MLILSRRRGESVIIGGGVVLTVLSMRDGVARIGITAPRAMPVDRAEVRARKDAEDEERRRATRD